MSTIDPPHEENAPLLPPPPLSSILFAACAGAVSAAVVTLVFHFTTASTPTIAIVDLQKILGAHINQIGSQNLGKAAAATDAARYAEALEASLDQLAKDDGVLILTAPAVVRGAPDLTEVLESRVNVRYAHAAPE